MYKLRYQHYQHDRTFPEARRSAAALVQEVNDFFAIPVIRDAMREQEETASMLDILTQPAGGSDETYGHIAERLRKAVNHTQKAEAYEGRLGFVGELSTCMEQLNMLQSGNSLISSIQPRELHQYATPLCINGLQIHNLIAMRLLLKTHDRRGADREDKIVTIADALHLGVSHEDRNADTQRALQRTYANCATQEQMKDAYSYCPSIIPMIQGVEFRHIKLHECSESCRAAMQFDLPKNAHALTCISELCTASLLEKEHPVFFRNRWNIGPQAQDGNIIDFEQGNIRKQFEAALHHIEDAILHYP